MSNSSVRHSGAYGRGVPGRSKQPDARQTSQERRRRAQLVRDEDNDYGFMNDDVDIASVHTPMFVSASAYSRLDESSSYAGQELLQPVTAPSGSHQPLPWGYIIMPQKEKKSTLTRRLIHAFVSATTDPEATALGFTPGQPTPDHIMEKVDKEHAAEEKKREEEERKREEDVRKSKLRRASDADARRRERLAQETQGRLRSQSLQMPRQMRAGITEEHARLREFDGKGRLGRLSTRPSKYIRQQYAERQPQDQSMPGY